MPNPEYWATLAQVLPVFALAVVVEARLISQRWDLTTPKWLRFTQSFIWVVTLLLLAFGESAALRALRGEEVPPWWTALMENAVSAAIGLLILGPALDLMNRGYAEGFAWITPGAWVGRLRLELVDHRTRRRHREFHALRRSAWQHLNWHEATDNHIASRIAKLQEAAAEITDSRLKEEIDGRVREMIALQQDAAGSHADFRKKYREIVMSELERERAFRENRIAWRRQLAEARAADRRWVTRSILANTTTTNGGVRQSHDIEWPGGVGPDDGGFLPLAEGQRVAAPTSSAEGVAAEPVPSSNNARHRHP